MLHLRLLVSSVEGRCPPGMMSQNGSVRLSNHEFIGLSIARFIDSFIH